MALENCTLDPSAYANAIATQNPKIQLAVAEHLVLNDPYANLLPTGTVEANIGENIVTVTNTRAVTNESLTRPVFGDLSASCGSTGNTAEWGQESYTTSLKLLRGQSQPICVNKNRFTVMGSLKSAVDQMKMAITQVYSADTRANIVDRAGTKAVLRSGDGSVAQTLTGGEYQSAVAWRGGVPTQQLTFAYLKALSDFARYTYQPSMYGNGADSHAVFVGSSEIVDVLRNEADVNNVLSVTTQGSFKDGKESLWNYAWIDVNFRGIKMAIDPKPLRFNTVDGSGAPVFIEPYVKTAMDYGHANLTNPAWLSAQYEIGILHYKDAFKRLVPSKYTGEGEAKFAQQSFGGELQWHYQIDSQCNVWGDFGFFKYQIARAFQDVAPWTSVPIAYRRCSGSLGFGGTCGAIPQVS
jgi:hypothetical protein